MNILGDNIINPENIIITIYESKDIKYKIDVENMIYLYQLFYKDNKLFKCYKYYLGDKDIYLYDMYYYFYNKSNQIYKIKSISNYFNIKINEIKYNDDEVIYEDNKYILDNGRIISKINNKYRSKKYYYTYDDLKLIQYKHEEYSHSNTVKYNYNNNTVKIERKRSNIIIKYQDGKIKEFENINYKLEFEYNKNEFIYYCKSKKYIFEFKDDYINSIKFYNHDILESKTEFEFKNDILKEIEIVIYNKSECHKTEYESVYSPESIDFIKSDNDIVGIYKEDNLIISYNGFSIHNFKE